jgi:hypothetical protein
MAVEVGRPEVGTKLSDLELFTMALADSRRLGRNLCNLVCVELLIPRRAANLLKKMDSP